MLIALHRRTARGFTLTELAIVLGVVGMILSAIWVAGAKVNAGQKSQKAAAQMLQISGNYRTLYAMHGVDVADGTDVTCLGVNSNFFPADMITKTCTSGDTTTYPRTPWGGTGYVQALANRTNSGITLGYFGLPQDGCNNLVNTVAGSSEIIYQRINTVSHYLPPVLDNNFYTATEIAAACTADGNTVELMFKAR